MKKAAEYISRVGGCALLLTGANAWAQSEAPTGTAEVPLSLAPMVVTATRGAQDSADAPAAVSVIRRQDIDDRNVTRLPQALGKVPGVYLGRAESGQSPFTEASFSLRGMDQRRTLILMDGVQPLQNGTSQGVNWSTLHVDDVERVEVVPGAFSSLYGSNAIGGVINVISKRAAPREFTMRASKGFGDAAGDGLSLYYRDKFESGLGINLGATWNRRDGYVSDYVARQSVAGAPGQPVTGAIPTTTREGAPAWIIGDKGPTPWREGGAMLRLSYDLDAYSRVFAGVGWAEARSKYGRYNTYLRDADGNPVATGTVGIDGLRFVLGENLFVNSTPLEESSRRGYAGYDGIVGDWTIKADAAVIDREFRYGAATAASRWDGGPGTFTTLPNTTTNLSLQAGRALGARHSLLLGAAWQRDETDRIAYTSSDWRSLENLIAATGSYNGRSHIASIYAQDEWRLADKATLYSGARLDRWQTRGSFWQSSPAAQGDYERRSKTAFSPKLALVLRPVTDLTLRASLGRSFRAPSNLDLYSTTVTNSAVSPTGLNTLQSDPTLKPESGWSAEVGSEWRLSESARVGLTAYQTRLDDMIYTRRIDPSLSQRSNAGEAQVRGVDVFGAVQLARWLALDGSVSWINARVLSNDADASSVGKRLPTVPPRLASLGLTAHQGAWRGSFDLRYTDKVFVNASNTDTVQGVPSGYDAYTVANLKLSYQIDPIWRLGLAVNNLADRQYYTFALMPGRNATVELVGTF